MTHKKECKHSKYKNGRCVECGQIQPVRERGDWYPEHEHYGGRHSK